MSDATVLIAAFSGRALAQSARRAGYAPLVADAFGDLDTRAAALDVRVVDGAMHTGFRAKSLIAALDQLVAVSPTPPIGLVLGSGLEDKVRLVGILADRYGLLGCSVETLRACKDPNVFFPVLDQLGIAHPETRTTPPQHPEGWLSKRVGGSGGRHIRPCTRTSQARPRRYFQRHVEGPRISVSAVVADGIAVDLTRQWCAPSPSHPFRYGGAVSLPWSHTAAERAMLSAVGKLALAFDLVGLVSFDFIVDGETALLLEINPRPGASLDCVDTPDGSRFHSHIAACRERKSIAWDGTSGAGAKAACILHADRGAVTVGDFDWPAWAADRPAAGSQTRLHEPLATVLADGDTPTAAESLAAKRLEELADLIYERSFSSGDFQ